ncbi:MAG: hypothetical protein MK135_09565, partial [Polyangiaceae bacterium]|nr:hypothetical protein [Polyangiaceae bacterium]
MKTTLPFLGLTSLSCLLTFSCATQETRSEISNKCYQVGFDQYEYRPVGNTPVGNFEPPLITNGCKIDPPLGPDEAPTGNEQHCYTDDQGACIGVVEAPFVCACDRLNRCALTNEDGAPVTTYTADCDQIADPYCNWNVGSLNFDEGTLIADDDDMSDDYKGYVFNSQERWDAAIEAYEAWAASAPDVVALINGLDDKYCPVDPSDPCFTCTASEADITPEEAAAIETLREVYAATDTQFCSGTGRYSYEFPDAAAAPNNQECHSTGGFLGAVDAFDVWAAQNPEVITSTSGIEPLDCEPSVVCQELCDLSMTCVDCLSSQECGQLVSDCEAQVDTFNANLTECSDVVASAYTKIAQDYCANTDLYVYAAGDEVRPPTFVECKDRYFASGDGVTGLTNLTGAAIPGDL